VQYSTSNSIPNWEQYLIEDIVRTVVVLDIKLGSKLGTVVDGELRTVVLDIKIDFKLGTGS
jgi:hypothetical protein